MRSALGELSHRQQATLHSTELQAGVRQLCRSCRLPLGQPWQRSSLPRFQPRMVGSSAYTLPLMVFFLVAMVFRKSLYRALTYTITEHRFQS